MSVERLWLGNDGKYQVQASYVCLFQDKKVKLRKPNGAMIAIPLNLLCSDDIAFIATQSKLPTRDSTLKKMQKSKTLATQDISTSSSYYSGETLTTTPESQKTEFLNKKNYAESEPLLFQVTTSAMNQNVRHLSEDESTQMIPKRSLSSITDQFKRQTFLPESRHNTFIDTKNLANIPSRAASLISFYLDFRSRLQLSCVSRRLHQIVFKPEVWKTVLFDKSDHYMINDKYYYKMVVYLQQRGNLQKAIKHVDLDGTVVTSASVLLSVKYLENLDSISTQGCWNILTYQLAADLTKLAMRYSSKYPSKISKVTLGKVLHRGPVTTENMKDEQNILDSKSFGQDAWFMNAALNKLTSKNVIFDVVTCGNCHVGAASQDFMCISCGILPLKKCAGCAPRCDRCANRTCGLLTCNDPKIKVQIARCGRCESILALCNRESSKSCQEARKPCESCHRLYHVRCRTTDGTYLSNQCTGCGVVSCPHCELSGCSGGCHGQWCQKCVPKAHLGHCKCIVIQGKAKTSVKSMVKRNVCGKCQKSCNRCGIDHFCDRCLHLHGAKCA